MPGIYLHIPFCVKKCCYCDFPSYDGKLQYMEAYVRALAREARRRADEYEWGAFDTVFFGGGTPSLLSGELLAELMDMLRAQFAFAPDAECTIECNPGTVSADKFAAYFRAGINRLSIGVQSMDNSLLARIGRIHTASQCADAFEAARAAGFTNIGADIMLGLPGQTELDYLSTIRDVAALAPTHVSAYSLILEEDTPLLKDVKKNTVTLPPEDETCIMQDIGAALLHTHGYVRYEISNYERGGHACRHNLNYWRNGPYLGLGAGAHSAWRVSWCQEMQWSRWENTADLAAYLQAPDRPLAKMDVKRIPPREEAFECVMLGLRMVKGMELKAFEERLGLSLENMYPAAIERLIKKGWLILEDGYARLTEHGLDMQNAALLEFM